MGAFSANGIQKLAGDGGRSQREFHSLATLSGFPLVTADGEKRPIRNFLFDDRSWTMEYLVVDAGSWRSPRPVVVVTSAVDLPDWKGKCVRSGLTGDQLANSPPAETVRPVSRQQELAWSRHFGWPENDPYWRGPTGDAAHLAFAGAAGDDPHLRRTEDLRSYEVSGPDGLAGQLEGYLLEDGSWHIGYLLVRTAEWTYGERLVATADVQRISWAERRVVIEADGAGRLSAGDQRGMSVD